MIRALLPVTTLLFLTTGPAYAIPTCVPGTMADYLALIGGCRFGAITVSDFSYSGSTESVSIPAVFDVPASLVSVVPSLPLGTSSLRLTFSSDWTNVSIFYTAATDAAWIRQFNLLFFGGGPEASAVGAHATPGGDLLTIDDPAGFIPIQRFFDTRSFDPISLTRIAISGSSAAHPFGSVNSFAFDVVTPEPVTLLLWAVGATGLALALWWRSREHRDQAA